MQRISPKRRKIWTPSREIRRGPGDHEGAPRREREPVPAGVATREQGRASHGGGGEMSRAGLAPRL